MSIITGNKSLLVSMKKHLNLKLETKSASKNSQPLFTQDKKGETHVLGSLLEDKLNSHKMQIHTTV